MAQMQEILKRVQDDNTGESAKGGNIFGISPYPLITKEVK